MKEQVRRVAERLSRHVVLKRRMPLAFNREPVHVTSGAMLRLWAPSLTWEDPMLFRLADEFVSPGSNVWDIGANVGLFSVAAACRSGPRGRVVAVEADTCLVEVLRRTARSGSGQRAHIDVIPAAIGASVDLATFQIARRGRAANHLGAVLGSSQTGGVREEQTVVSLTLDWLARHRPVPDVVKIDVEGAELLVLAGSTELLTQHRPVLCVEVQEANANQVGTILHNCGYTLYDAEVSSWRRPVSSPRNNTIAIPDEVAAKKE